MRRDEDSQRTLRIDERAGLDVDPAGGTPARLLSAAWPLGWLSISGPVLEVAGNLPSLAGFPLLPWVSILLDLWAFVSVLIGVTAIVLGIKDMKARPNERPRLASPGLALGLIGTTASACLFVAWMLSDVSF